MECRYAVLCAWMRWWSLCGAFKYCILLIVQCWTIFGGCARAGHYNEQQQFSNNHFETRCNNNMLVGATVVVVRAIVTIGRVAYDPQTSSPVWQTENVSHNKYIGHLLLLYKAINMIYCLFNYVIFMLCAVCV